MRRGAAGGRVAGGGPGGDAHRGVVGLVVQPQDEFVLGGAREAAVAEDAVSREDHVDADARAVAQQPDHALQVAAVVEGGVLAVEDLEPVDHEHDVRKPLTRLGHAAQFGQIGGAAGSQHTLTEGEFRGEPVQEAAEAFGLVAVDDGPAVGQCRQRVQRPVAAVDAVEVDVVGAVGLGERGGQGAQCLRPAAAGRADDVQVAGPVEVEGEGRAALLGGQVDHAVRDGGQGRLAFGGRLGRRRGLPLQHVGDQFRRAVQAHPDPGRDRRRVPGQPDAAGAVTADVVVARYQPEHDGRAGARHHLQLGPALGLGHVRQRCAEPEGHAVAHPGGLDGGLGVDGVRTYVKGRCPRAAVARVADGTRHFSREPARLHSGFGVDDDSGGRLIDQRIKDADVQSHGLVSFFVCGVRWGAAGDGRAAPGGALSRGLSLAGGLRPLGCGPVTGAGGGCGGGGQWDVGRVVGCVGAGGGCGGGGQWDVGRVVG